MDRLEAAIAAWQGGINAKANAGNGYDLADGAADFPRWGECMQSVCKGLRTLGVASSQLVARAASRRYAPE